jgi:hypothetical protein
MSKTNPQIDRIRPSKRLSKNSLSFLSNYGLVLKANRSRHLQYTQIERHRLIKDLKEVVELYPQKVFEMVETVISHAIEDWVLESNSLNSRYNRTGRHHFNIEKQEYPNQFTLAILINGLLKNAGSEHKTIKGLTSYKDLVFICDSSGITDMISDAITNYDLGTNDDPSDYEN